MTTTGGLTREKLKLSKSNKIVSAEKSKRARKNWENENGPKLWWQAAQEARKELNLENELVLMKDPKNYRNHQTPATSKEIMFWKTTRRIYEKLLARRKASSRRGKKRRS